MDWFNEIFDLAAVASAAGLFGGATSTVAAVAVSGVVLKFILRTLVTAAVTGVGFFFLLDWLGFEIVATEEAPAPFRQGVLESGERFQAERMPPEGAAKQDASETVYVIRSPFRGG